MMRRIMIAMVAIGMAATTALVTACDTDTAATGTQAATATSATTSASTPSARGTPATNTAASGTTASAVGCGETTREWTTNESAAPAMSTGALYLVRAGRHDCYDRVVFDINGPADIGYVVQYVPVVTADGSGAPVPVAGGAALEVIVRAPAQGADNGGHLPGRPLAATGEYFYTPAQLAGWRSLRAVRFAGTFEGQSTFAVGVRDELVFRVFTQLDTSSQIRRLVVDVAHGR